GGDRGGGGFHSIAVYAARPGIPDGAGCSTDASPDPPGQGASVTQEGTFEAALSATEAQAAATLQSAAAVTRELKRVKAGSAAGQTRELRRALEAAETLAAQLAEGARALRAGDV